LLCCFLCTRHLRLVKLLFGDSIILFAVVMLLMIYAI